MVGAVAKQDNPIIWLFFLCARQPRLVGVRLGRLRRAAYQYVHTQRGLLDVTIPFSYSF